MYIIFCQSISSAPEQLYLLLSLIWLSLDPTYHAIDGTGHIPLNKPNNSINSSNSINSRTAAPQHVRTSKNRYARLPQAGVGRNLPIPLKAGRSTFRSITLLQCQISSDYFSDRRYFRHSKKCLLSSLRECDRLVKLLFSKNSRVFIKDVM